MLAQALPDASSVGPLVFAHADDHTRANRAHLLADFHPGRPLRRDCEDPRVVLIDFGLAEGFSSTSSGASGTAGGLTWESVDEFLDEWIWGDET